MTRTGTMTAKLDPASVLAVLESEARPMAVRELSRRLGYTTPTVLTKLNALVADGRVSRTVRTVRRACLGEIRRDIEVRWSIAFTP